jgi:hypothetical protein
MRPLMTPSEQARPGAKPISEDTITALSLGVTAASAPNRFVAQTSPFADSRADVMIASGATIEEMLDHVGLKQSYRPFAEVTLHDPEMLEEPVSIPARRWASVRPKPGVTVALRVAPRGGGGGGKKSVLGIILRVIVIILAAVASYFGTPAAGAAVMPLGTFQISGRLPR